MKKIRSVELLAELGQEVADLQTLVKAYEMVRKNDRSRIHHLQTELRVAIYEKLQWQSQAKRSAQQATMVDAEIDAAFNSLTNNWKFDTLTLL